jgi:uncharacterized membrane protein
LITDPTAIFAVLAGIVALALALERRWHLFRSFGAAFIGILLGMVLSNTGVLPGRSPAYDFLVGPAVSAGIVLILLSVDVRTIVKAGPTMLAAFAIGAVGSMVGAAVAALTLARQVGPETWKLAGQYAATYTGGGANFAAVGAALGTSGDLFAAGVAADVIVTAVWMAICLTVPVLLARARGTADEIVDRPNVGEAGGRLYATLGSVEILDVALLAVIALGTLWASAALGRVLPGLPSVLWLTTIALVLAQIPQVQRIRGAGVIGNWLILLFLASNGAKSVVANIIAVGPPVMWFALTTVAVHGVIIFGVGMLVRLDPRTLAVASQANVGGSASAMALASARGWASDLLPGVAVGLLGNAVGNYLGIAVAVVVRGWLGA